MICMKTLVWMLEHYLIEINLALQRNTSDVKKVKKWVCQKYAYMQISLYYKVNVAIVWTKLTYYYEGVLKDTLKLKAR